MDVAASVLQRSTNGGFHACQGYGLTVADWAAIVFPLKVGGAEENGKKRTYE